MLPEDYGGSATAQADGSKRGASVHGALEKSGLALTDADAERG